MLFLPVPSKACYMLRFEFDVIVIGGGHAGTEAAAASARMVGENPAHYAQKTHYRGDVLQSGHRRHSQRNLG